MKTPLVNKMLNWKYFYNVILRVLFSCCVLSWEQLDCPLAYEVGGWGFRGSRRTGDWGFRGSCCTGGWVPPSGARAVNSACSFITSTLRHIGRSELLLRRMEGLSVCSSSGWLSCPDFPESTPRRNQGSNSDFSHCSWPFKGRTECLPVLQGQRTAVLIGNCSFFCGVGGLVCLSSLWRGVTLCCSHFCKKTNF